MPFILLLLAALALGVFMGLPLYFPDVIRSVIHEKTDDASEAKGRPPFIFLRFESGLFISGV